MIDPEWHTQHNIGYINAKQILETLPSVTMKTFMTCLG